ncbi:unknown protein [Seminavis robusta]|uniref:Uncharacterized protein n=1 Tax=Seminavis robusta TaxID=568900 RepID=A0A9N8DZX6_9STRA|nr:unknown protein [Seminavis robusta]|eukprot:Sro482_g151800.1 n/a (380) ;mRNA; r:22195-23486
MDDLPALVEPDDLIYPDDEEVYLPRPRVMRNPDTASDEIVQHATRKQYQDELAFCASKVEEMLLHGMDLQGDANKKLHEINQERIRNGYPVLREFVFETHKATRFCDIWGFDEDAYIQRYHRWLSDIDLLTEGVEEANDVEEPTTEVAETAIDDSSHDSDEVNMGGINLRMMERYIDNLEVAEEEGPVDNDSGDSQEDTGEETSEDASEETSGIDSGLDTGVRSPSSLGSPVLDNEQVDAEIDTILKRRINWGIMSQLPAPESEEEESKNQEVAEQESEEENEEDDDEEDEDEDVDESPTKKQRLEEQSVEEQSVQEDVDEEATFQEEATVDGEATVGQESADGDSSEDGDNAEDGDSSNNNNNETSGPILLATGSWSY